MKTTKGTQQRTDVRGQGQFSRVHLIVLTMLALVALVLPGHAQISTQVAPNPVVPHMVRYNGTVTGDSNQRPGIAGITFALYKDQDGGAPLWLETQNATVDASGHYSVQLGATRPEGLPADLFASGEARWLSVQIVGQAEQPRILLLSVPYALKAGDAETLGGLPASAFMLAAPGNSSGNNSSGNSGAPAAGSTSTSAPPPGSSGVTTSGGTVNAIPLWTTASDVENSAISQTGSGATAKIGIGTITPITALDVKGGGTFRGTLTLPATGAATAAGGKNSQAQRMVASTFDGPFSLAVNQTFQWQVEPAGNNTSSPSATLNLLYGVGATPPSETGLNVGNAGVIKFAPGQTFPGTTGSIGLSAPASDFTVTGSPITTAGTLNLAWNIPPTDANIPSAIVKRDASGNFTGNTISANALYAGTLTLNNYLSLVGAQYAYSTGNVPTIWGVAAAGSGAVQGVEGETLSTDPGASGVFGTADPSTGSSNGVYGVANASGAGVLGKNQGTGSGVYGVASGSAGQGVWGESFGGGISNGVPSDGVHGVSHSTSGAGVGGTNDATDGTGVWGSDKSGYGFATDSHAFQSRSAGGWLKAMAYINGTTVVRCFNGQLTGSTASTTPCGITVSNPGGTQYIVDFGFKVDDRFVQVSFRSNGSYDQSNESDAQEYYGLASDGASVTSSQLFVFEDLTGTAFTTIPFYVFVY